MRSRTSTPCSASSSITSRASCFRASLGTLTSLSPQTSTAYVSVVLCSHSTFLIDCVCARVCAFRSTLRNCSLTRRLSCPWKGSSFLCEVLALRFFFLLKLLAMKKYSQELPRKRTRRPCRGEESSNDLSIDSESDKTRACLKFPSILFHRLYHAMEEVVLDMLKCLPDDIPNTRSQPVEEIDPWEEEFAKANGRGKVRLVRGS